MYSTGNTNPDFPHNPAVQITTQFYTGVSGKTAYPHSRVVQSLHHRSLDDKLQVKKGIELKRELPISTKKKLTARHNQIYYSWKYLK